MARTKQNKPSLEASPRHLWLAGLGLAAMAGKLAVQAASRAVDRAQQARETAMAAVDTAQSKAIEAAGDLRERLQTGVVQLNATVESAVSPLVARFRPAKARRTVRRGRKPAAKAGRRAAAKKPVARRTRKA